MSPDMCTIYSNTNIKRGSMGGNFSFILIEFNPLLINIQRYIREQQEEPHDMQVEDF